MERANLDPLRNGAVFHFLPERFAETLQKATCNECPFIEAEEIQNKSVYYPFADVITAENTRWVCFRRQSLRFSSGECHDKDPRTNLNGLQIIRGDFGDQSGRHLRLTHFDPGP
jgi:hypothetical protein